jgi:hypothetical protein
MHFLYHHYRVRNFQFNFRFYANLKSNNYGTGTCFFEAGSFKSLKI